MPYDIKVSVISHKNMFVISGLVLRKEHPHVQLGKYKEVSTVDVSN